MFWLFYDNDVANRVIYVNDFHNVVGPADFHIGEGGWWGKVDLLRILRLKNTTVYNILKEKDR